MPLTEADTRQSGQANPPAGAAGAGNDRPRRRRWWLVALGGLAAVGLIVTGVLAVTYQPVGFGGSWGGGFPGLPSGVGVRTVNTFGDANGALYVPPQRGVFSLTESIQNFGLLPVTIEAVTVVRPGQAGISPWPLRPGGTTLYLPEYGPRPATGRPVAGLSLRPGQAIVVGIPARLSSGCYVPNGWSGATFFYVKERFLFFTRWVALRLGTRLIFHEPEIRASIVACQPGS